MTVIVNDQRSYPHGVPCWIDLEQPDPAAATAFYGALFGWEFHDAMPPGAPGSYLIASLDGHDVAAVASGASAAGWQTYIACDDAGAATDAVRAHGGTVVSGPEDAGPGGRTATCRDPHGADFHLWQARRRLGAQLVNVPCTWNFSDLHTSDPAGALAFYGAVFGWVVDPALGAGMIRLPGYGDHLASTVDPDIRERQAFAPPGFADVVAGLTEDTERAGWGLRFTVADRDATVATVERLGGAVITSADTMWTQEAEVADSQGATFVVSQFSPPE